jgi:hypothetical protein
MSRLIFEGDTTKRFGEKFPRPFIEQVRAYDDGLEVDIAFYFKVPNEQQKVDSFIADLKNGSLSQSIVLSVINQTTLDRVKLGRNFDTLVKNQIGARTTEMRLADTEEIMTKIISFADFVSGQETPPQESESYSSYNVAIKDDFYSLDGTRYMKIFATLVADYNSSDELYIAFFVKNGLNREKYQNQTSDLIFEKVLNKDRTLTRDPIVAFKEQNGTFYYQQPLMSLSKRYHKTDDYGHTEMIKQFSNVLSGYSIDESNDLLTLLDTESANPRLLILIKNKIDNFTDKSPATPTGRLYSQLASNIVLADSLINRQEIVNKRQFTNKKIVDRRAISLPNLDKKETYGPPFYAQLNILNWFLPKPLISRNLFPFYNPQNTDLFIDISTNPPQDVTKYFKIETSAYYFFDFEKVINYKSQISNFINPYNIEQIFGKGSLASYFYFSNCTLEKIPLKAGINTRQLSRKKAYYLNYLNENEDIQNLRLIQSNQEQEVNFHLINGSRGKISTIGNISSASLVFKKQDKETIYSSLMQRGFDTHKGLNGYRLSLFELQDYQVAGQDGLFLLENIDLDFNIKIEDRTMEFYDIHIRQKIFSILENLEKYYNYASDFCSYNNIDGRFNDFFLQNIRNQFDEPYPWVEAPFYYYAFLQMITASTNEDGTRRRDGTLLDLESIRQASIHLKELISPETGNLESLRIFYENLKSLVENYFTQGSGLDEGGEIYSETSEIPYELINPDINLDFSRTDRFFADNISSDFNAEEIENIEDFNFQRCVELLSKNDLSPSQSMENEIEQRKCYDIPSIEKVLQCRNYAKEWAEDKNEFDRWKRKSEEENEEYDVDIEYHKTKMEESLGSYQNSDCPQLIGPIQELYEGDSLGDDFVQAGVVE